MNDYEERLSELETLVSYLADQNEKKEMRILALEARLPLELEGGRLPTIMSHLECQIFYTPPDMIPAKHKRIKTEWSMRLTAWVAGRRAKPDINVKLYPGNRFYHQVMELHERPIIIEHAASGCEDRDDLAAGMLLAITKQKGRPYIKSQFCVMNGHLEDSPHVIVVVDGKEHEFKDFRPGAGTKAGKAKWYAKLTL